MTPAKADGIVQRKDAADAACTLPKIIWSRFMNHTLHSDLVFRY
jgi:hypothetical protein